MRILILEDDAAIGNGLLYSLTQEGFEATLCATVGEAKEKIEDGDFGLYLLDLTLPDGLGYDVCRLVKSRFDVPVIFLTAYDDEVNVVAGLELGADDYIAKPFRLRELLARIKSVLRRYNGVQGDMITVGDVIVKPAEAKVQKDGKELFLTALEYKLFLALLQNRGTVLSRNRLLEEIWDAAGDFVNDNTLTVYIKRLREKIENDPDDPQIIITVRGLGYKVM